MSSESGKQNSRLTVTPQRRFRAITSELRPSLFRMQSSGASATLQAIAGFVSRF